MPWYERDLITVSNTNTNSNSIIISPAIASHEDLNTQRGYTLGLRHSTAPAKNQHHIIQGQVKPKSIIFY